MGKGDCEICGKGLVKGQRYTCGIKCRDARTIAKRVLFEFDCEVCGKHVQKRRMPTGAKLCSKGCIGELNRRRITGTRDESKHEAYRCRTCGKEGDRLKAGKNGKVREFCSKSCKSKHFYSVGVEEALHAAKSFDVELFDGKMMRVKSRWEAAFIKDYLEPSGAKWKYEPQRFELANGTGYYPDFFIESEDLWVEIKGTKYYDLLNKTGQFAAQHPQLNYVVADHDVLTNRFGLDLSQARLHEVCEKVQER